jgi:hypothetical protein
MKTELDPNLPNRTRTLAARFDHPNSSSIVTPAGLTLPETGPPGKRAREWRVSEWHEGCDAGAETAPEGAVLGPEVAQTRGPR